MVFEIVAIQKLLEPDAAVAWCKTTLPIRAIGHKCESCLCLVIRSKYCVHQRLSMARILHLSAVSSVSTKHMYAATVIEQVKPCQREPRRCFAANQTAERAKP